VSTSFFVLPSKKYIPSYKAILDLANMNTITYLTSIGVHRKINIQFNLQDINTHELVNFCLEDEVLHNEEGYAWFFVPEVPGGTDCWYHKNLPIDREIWMDELNTNPNAQKNKKIIMKNMNIGYQWSFRRSAGQPDIVFLIYGMLSAALAELTDGIIYSDDGAWDYSVLPTTSDDFIKGYLRPNLANNKYFVNFANDCIKRIKSELANN